MKSKIAKPEVKVIMFQALNVISTSGDTNYESKTIVIEGLNNNAKAWMQEMSQK